MHEEFMLDESTVSVYPFKEVLSAFTLPKDPKLKYQLVSFA